MNFRDTPQQAVWRAEVRAFLSQHFPAELRTLDRFGERPNAEGTRDALSTWRQALSQRGWIAPAWPTEYGGAALSAIDQFILNEEFAEAGTPTLGLFGVMMLGPTLIEHGSEEQKKRHIPAILDGSVNWCQGYSEPGAGSDLASLQTRAVRDGDDFLISGQKIWTSGAHLADWCFLLARTNPDAPKHRGITYFLVDMKSPGIEIRPLVNMLGRHGFNEVFFDNVRVPRSNVVGEVDRGWYIGTTTLDFERSGIGNAVGQRRLVEEYVTWFRENQAAAPPSTARAAGKAWAERWVEVAVATLLAHRIISMQAAGKIPNAEASVAKLFNTELSQRISRTALTMLGTWGGLVDERAPLAGDAGRGYLDSVSLTIAGGTSEIQRNIVATRGLGLPRT